MIDLNIFKINLALTQQYCEQQLIQTGKHFADILRSINPTCWLGDGDAPLFTYSYWSCSTDPAYNAYITQWGKDPIYNLNLIEWLFDTQHNIKQHYTPQMPDIYKGRILAFRIDNTLCDGAAAVETFGLLDDYNCPPVDTWFYLHRASHADRVLFAWIPDQFVNLVDNGIAVNPEGCIEWLDVWYPEMWKNLRELFEKFG